MNYSKSSCQSLKVSAGLLVSPAVLQSTPWMDHTDISARASQKGFQSARIPNYSSISIQSALQLQNQTTIFTSVPLPLRSWLPILEFPDHRILHHADPISKHLHRDISTPFFAMCRPYASYAFPPPFTCRSMPRSLALTSSSCHAANTARCNNDRLASVVLLAKKTQRYQSYSHQSTLPSHSCREAGAES